LREVEERGRAAGLHVIAEAATALEAEGLWALGDARIALTRFRKAVTALQSTGDIPALASACIAQARAMSDSVDPDLVFKPIADWMDTEAAVVARIERQIARGRYQKAMGKPSDDAFDEAQRLIDQLGVPLDQIDAAALRLHPWMRFVRRARRDEPGDPGGEP
ncbi:MAG: hypothetical protein ABMB14_05415, partial [Myxococcota bacterium]